MSQEDPAVAKKVEVVAKGQESEPLYTKQEVEEMIRARNKQKDELLAKQQQQVAQLLARSKEDEDKGAAPLTREEMETFLRDYEVKRQQQQAMNQMVSQHLQLVGKAKDQDKEFEKLLADKGETIPPEYQLVLTAMLGEDSLPVLKAALKDESVRKELLALQDEMMLARWASAKRRELSALPKEAAPVYGDYKGITSIGVPAAQEEGSDIDSLIKQATV